MHRGWVVSPDYRSVIDGIKAVRTSLGVSQRELGRRLGKTPSFVNKIEQLERRLDILEFIAIANALNVEAPKLLAEISRQLPDEIRI